MLTQAEQATLALFFILSLAGCNYPRKAKDYETKLLNVGPQQLLYRFRNAYTFDEHNKLVPQGLYVPEPEMVDKLDLDDRHELNEYRFHPELLTNKAAAAHIDLNTVLVKPDPSNIRLFEIEETVPEHLWRLFLLTGDDTATLLTDGVHVRRKGFPEQILGGPVDANDQRIQSEMGTILWRNDPGRGWYLDRNGGGIIRGLSFQTVHEIKKHEDLGPIYRVDCNALRRFARPLDPGESTREMIVKIDVPVTPAEREKLKQESGTASICQVDFADLTRDGIYAKGTRGR